MQRSRHSFPLDFLLTRRGFLALPALCAAGRVLGRDTAAAAVADDGYPPVVAGRALTFPRDFGAHPAYRNEWWYVTGWLDDAEGNERGFQITFFRNRPRIAESNESRFAPRQLLFAHAAIADPRVGHLVIDERSARAGFDLAEATEATTQVWIGNWSLMLEAGSYTARVLARDFALELSLVPRQAVLLQGDAGFSRKGSSENLASYYYSQPQLAVTGTLDREGRRETVRGTAWLDHEWSSAVLSADAVGWDWCGINFDDGGALMAFRIRDKMGNALWAGGALRLAGGELHIIARDAVVFTERRRWTSPRTQASYPVSMAVTVAQQQYDLEPLFDDQELDARASTGTVYWEGAVRAKSAGRAVGRAYLELTGYVLPLRL